MVFAVQCPNPKCRKFMLVEDHQKGQIVPCLLCKTQIKVGGTSSAKPVVSKPGQSGPTS